MPIKILHTADLHLGMKFLRGYIPAVQESLIEARFNILSSLIDKANKQQADLLAIAGDLFHSRNVAKKDILRTTDKLKGFQGKLVLVLPGNHDFIQNEGDPLWSYFREIMAESVVVLTDPKPYDLRPHGIDATAFAAPCNAQHSSTNTIGWIRDYKKTIETKFCLGLAHGSLEGLSPDFNENYFPMSTKDLSIPWIDIWLMGHTHVRYPDKDKGTNERVFFPSTPEPDGFDCKHPGYAWLIELKDDKSVHYQSITTGSYRFLTMEAILQSDDDVEKLKEALKTHNADEILVKLAIKGRIDGNMWERRGAIISDLRKQMLHLEDDTSEWLRQITMADINREFTENSFPHSLLSLLEKEGGDPLTLQMAYDLIQEAKT